jgi:sRNA-binding protein
MMPIRPEVHAAITLLAELFPKVFFVYETRRKPLKVGIDADIRAAVGEMPELSAALSYYCNNDAYLRRLVAGAVRVDLTGCSAGEVTPRQAGYAALVLQHRMAKHARKKGEPVSEAVPTPTITVTDETAPPVQIAKTESAPPSPKRLGLADLKAARAQRIRSAQPGKVETSP